MRNAKARPLATTDLSNQILHIVNLAGHRHLVKKGANEVVKSLSRGAASLVILAADADPIELLINIIMLCVDRNVAYVFVPSKAALGRATGIASAVIAVSLLVPNAHDLQTRYDMITDQVYDLL